MKLSFWQTARYWMLLLLVFLITISSHPTVVDISRAAGMESGTILSRYIILVFAILFLMCFNMKSTFKPKLIRVSWFLWFLIVFFYLMTYSFFGKRSMMGDIRSIAICLIAIMIGWQMDLDRKRFQALLIAFAGLTLFVGLMQVLVNVGGFVIRDQYQTDNKNSLGVMLATGGFSFFVLGLNNNTKRYIRWLMFAFAILSLVVLLTIRARASTLTMGMMVLYVMYERYKGRNFIFYLLVGISIVFLAYMVFPQSIKEFVYNSFFQNFEGGDITTGRSERNAAALEVLSQNIWIGNINAEAKVGQIHNYPLNRTFEFGLIFVLPIMILYLYLLFYDIKRTKKVNNHNNYNLGYYLLLIPFIISLAEPTFPFGPGTATVYNFLLFGTALRNTENEQLMCNQIDETSPNL